MNRYSVVARFASPLRLLFLFFKQTLKNTPEAQRPVRYKRAVPPVNNKKIRAEKTGSCKNNIIFRNTFFPCPEFQDRNSGKSGNMASENRRNFVGILKLFKRETSVTEFFLFIFYTGSAVFLPAERAFRKVALAFKKAAAGTFF